MPRVVFGLAGPGGGVYSVAFSPDGKTLASGSGDETIKLWRIYTAVDEHFLAAIRSGSGTGAGDKGPSLPPALSAAVTFSEPSDDNVLAANEEGALEITLSNSGKGSAYGVEVTLRLVLSGAEGLSKGEPCSYSYRTSTRSSPPGVTPGVCVRLYSLRAM